MSADPALVIGQALPETPWRRIEPEDVRRFCAITGENQWIHTDPERASRDLPGGTPLVPGALLVSFSVAWMSDLLDGPGIVRRLQRSYEAIRFRDTVPVGTPLCLRATPLSLRVLPVKQDQGGLERVYVVLEAQLLRRFKATPVLEGRFSSLLERETGGGADRASERDPRP
ncbi:MAG: MaoC family dehydratase [Rhodospirillaceae bacterium]